MTCHIQDRPRYRIEDINPYYFSCGHYGEYVVVRDPDGPFVRRDEAQAKADAMNKEADRRWKAFLAIP